MRPYILPTFLIIAEILYFIYILAKEHNEDFRNYIQKMKISILEKTKLNLNSEMKDVSRKSYILLLVVFIFTFFLDDKMVIILFITLFMILLLRLRISYEKFEKVFENYAPSIKKYNIYLSVLLMAQVLVIILTVICIK
jgi:hypothetical protein